MDDKQFYTIIMRHDTSTQWAVNNPILTLGEYAVEDDTHRVKRGDGETEWNDLPYEEFGLVYLITYENLSGEVSDNEALQEALDKKMSLKVFEDVDTSMVKNDDCTYYQFEFGKIGKYDPKTLSYYLWNGNSWKISGDMNRWMIDPAYAYKIIKNKDRKN